MDKDNDIDISDLLKEWIPTDSSNIRKVVDSEGAEKIQVRIDQGAFQGILQMELDGRPDGRKPHNLPFAMDFYKRKLKKHIENTGKTVGFSLTRKNCEEIFDENLRIYQRYVFLLQIEDYIRVVRDTERNMEAFRFVNRYGKHEEDRMHLEKWWPYIIRIHATARIMTAMDQREFNAALSIVEQARARIESLTPNEAEEFITEKDRSLDVLTELEFEIKNQKPLDLKEKLERDLKIAVKMEKYEEAAIIRDQIEELTGQPDGKRTTI